MTLPLAGVTVVDLATFLAAPVAATLLGEFGAEVIKVEQPGVGDDLRRLGRSPAEGRPSYWWLQEARNKKSITCNLRLPEGQALVKRLIAGAQVVTENFRPGTLERWGLGWEDLSRVNPALVMLRISAFGQTGPLRDRPGFGRIAAAVGGLSYVSGYPDRPPVTPGTPTVPDYLAGVFGALGALIALRHAERTGQGQVVDLALYEPVLRVLDDAVAVYGGTGRVRERIGSGTESAAPHNHYRTRDGRWLALACTNDRMFARLAEAVGHPEWREDPRLATTARRLEHRALVDELVAHWVARHDTKDALQILEAAEVPAAPVMSVADLVEDAQVRARGNLVELASEVTGRLLMPGVVPRLTRTPGEVRTAGPPRPGQHNDEVYGGRLGLSPEALTDLRARGVI
ncbi:MAG TPA: CoA transferase [Candidatus Binatia bacterium]|nr:CoA transferase [Candidatus Binatia bacterium]